MSEENISIFRQELERVKTQFEDKFQDIMTSVRADRENDKRTLQMVNENINNDRKAINQNRALNDKLETLLNVQNTMLSELRSMNNSIKDLSGGGGGGMGGMLAAAAAGAGAGFFLNGDGDNNVDGGGGNDGLRDTRGGDNVRTTRGITPSPTGTSGTGEISSDISNEDMAFEIYSAYRRAGFSHEQAKGLTGEVNRENAFNPDLIFGSHEEPANASLRNYGPLSYNQVRGENLLQYLRDQGLIDENGSIIRSRETLDAFGRFAMAEMTPEAEWSQDIPGAGSHAGMEKVQDFINNPDISEEEARRTMGGVGGYVAWARGQTRLRNGRPFDWEAHERRTMAGTRMVEELDFENRFSESIDNERESDAERVEREQAERISSDQFIRGHLKEMGVAGDGMSLYNPTIREQQGAGKVHGSSYRGASNAVRAYWTKEELETAGLSTGENTVQLTNPITGELETVNINIQSFDGGNNFATTDFIGTGTLGESREYWNPDLNQAQSIVQNLGGSLGDIDRRKKLNEYIQQNEGITIPYSEVDVEGPEGRRPYDKEAEDQNRLINEYVSNRFEPSSSGGGAEISGGNGVDDLSGDSGNDNLETQNTLVGPRIPETPPEQNQFDPFSLVSPMNVANDLMVAGLNENPEVRAALEEQAAADTEETTSGGYTGGGGGSREQEQPQIEANAIGRFPWAEKIIKYYNLSNMIKTNMLS